MTAAIRDNSGKPRLDLIPLAQLRWHFTDWRRELTNLLTGFAEAPSATALMAAFDVIHHAEGMTPGDVIRLEADVFAYGAAKYAAWNWTGHMAWSTILASLLRHLLALEDGDDHDEESGLPHLGHIACNLRMLQYGFFYRPEANDLFSPAHADRIASTSAPKSAHM